MLTRDLKVTLNSDPSPSSQDVYESRLRMTYETLRQKGTLFN